MPSHVPSFELNSGTNIPAIGMGCWMGAAGGGKRVYDMCTKALKNGYRHFDTASGYGNEKEVGEAIRDSCISREEVFITTKLPNHAHHTVLESFEQSLANLGCDYVDLYLMHWPLAVVQDASGQSRTLRPDEHPTFVDTWKEMEKLLDTGKVKAIGVSNFSVKTLDALLPHCTIIPATNQVELHPCLPQEDLVSFCAQKGILVTAYSPLGRSKALREHPIINEIAKEVNISPAQVLVSWAVQRNIITIPKSEDDERMQANIKLAHLSEEQMERIGGIHKVPGMHRSLLTYHSPQGGALGWSYDDFGWPMAVGGVIA